MMFNLYNFALTFRESLFQKISEYDDILYHIIKCDQTREKNLLKLSMINLTGKRTITNKGWLHIKYYKKILT